MYSQKDPRWADIRIGSTRKQIRTHGSQLCCVAGVLRGLGVDTDPARLNRYLAQVNGYRAGWHIVWPALEMYGVVLQDTIYYRLHTNMLKRILRWLAEELAVLVAIPPWPRWPGRVHWVRVHCYGAIGLVVHDPALPAVTQRPVALLPRYAMPDEGLNDVIRRAVALGIKERTNT